MAKPPSRPPSRSPGKRQTVRPVRHRAADKAHRPAQRPRDEREAPVGEKPARKPKLATRPDAARSETTRKPERPGPPRKVRIRADGSAAVRNKAAGERSGARPPVTLETAREDGLHRIAKLLARAGVASRRDVERMIAEGRVALNGQPVTTPATLLPDVNGVTVDGRPVAAPEAAQLYLFHKPAGTLTAARDFTGRRTIYDVLPPGLPRLMPVGRLDLNTEGLLLLTTDGALKRKLELPSSGVERTYRARAFGDVTQAQLEELAEGVEIDGMRYGRIDANMERRTGRNVWIEMTLTEGKNREVRRVLEHLGLRVARLIRTRYGPFVLGTSNPGDVEEAAAREVDQLMRLLK